MTAGRFRVSCAGDRQWDAPRMGEALVAAVGIALSPFAVVPAILLLFSPRPAAGSAAFGGGWAAGTAGVALVAVLLADLMTIPESPPAWASWTRIVLGASLLVLGVGKFRARSEAGGPPSWLRSLEAASPGRAARFGVLASGANPKIALLAVAGGFSIGAELSGAAREILAVLGFAAVGASTALLPVTAYVALGDRALVPLGRAKDWLVANVGVVMAAVLGVIGVLLIWKGVSAL